MTPIEMKGKRSVKLNLNVNQENKHTINSRIIFADMFNKKLLTLQLVLEIQPHKSLKNVLKKLMILMTKCSPSQLILLRFLIR